MASGDTRLRRVLRHELRDGHLPAGLGLLGRAPDEATTSVHSSIDRRVNGTSIGSFAICLAGFRSPPPRRTCRARGRRHPEPGQTNSAPATLCAIAIGTVWSSSSSVSSPLAVRVRVRMLAGLPNVVRSRDGGSHSRMSPLALPSRAKLPPARRSPETGMNQRAMRSGSVSADRRSRGAGGVGPTHGHSDHVVAVSAGPGPRRGAP